MADKTKIEWCTSPDGSLGASWNPVGGCSVASRGCEGCYAAERVAPRQQAQGHPVYDGVVKKTKAGIYRFTGKMTAAPDDHPVWTQPLRWRKPRRIFVCSTSDLFHESRSVEQIDRVFAVAALSPQHTFLLLTKRAREMREYFQGGDDNLGFVGDEWTTTWHRREGVRAAMQWLGQFGYWDRLGKIRRLPLPNVWLGVSVEDQQRADERIPDLLATPAALRFLSVEPMLDFVDLRRIHRRGHELPSPMRVNDEDLCILNSLTGDATWPACHLVSPTIAQKARIEDGELYQTQGEWRKIDLVIAGGESGARSRPTPEGAFEALRDQCAAAGTPFFMKQMQNKAPIPEHLQIRQWPEVAR